MIKLYLFNLITNTLYPSDSQWIRRPQCSQAIHRFKEVVNEQRSCNHHAAIKLFSNLFFGCCTKLTLNHT